MSIGETRVNQELVNRVGSHKKEKGRFSNIVLGRGRLG